MNIEELREHCLSIKGAHECFPFDDTVLVFKVMEKMFAYIGLEPKDNVLRVNLKCDPSRSEELRDQYAGVGTGVHAAKSLLWNAVELESDVPGELIRELVNHSAEEVIKKLPKKKQEEYKSF